MHESHIAADLVAEASRIARRENAPISRVRLRIGARSHVLPQTLRIHFVAHAQGSPLENAAVDIVKDQTAESRADGVTLVSLTVEEA